MIDYDEINDNTDDDNNDDDNSLSIIDDDDDDEHQNKNVKLINIKMSNLMSEPILKMVSMIRIYQIQMKIM